MINHKLESWTFANAAARNAAGTYVPGDVGRIAYQTDTGQYWRLTATTPTWQLVEGLSIASSCSVLAAPATTASLTAVMCGLGGAPNIVGITPVKGTHVLATFHGSLIDNTSGGLVTVTMYYGTGAAPSVNAAVTGTQLGGVVGSGGAGSVGNVYFPFSCSGIFTAIPGTHYWLDFSQYVSSGTGGFQYLSATLVELP